MFLFMQSLPRIILVDLSNRLSSWRSSMTAWINGKHKSHDTFYIASTCTDDKGCTFRTACACLLSQTAISHVVLHIFPLK